jgi:hypothetical protein
LAHVLCHQLLDLFPDVPAPDLQLLKLVPSQLKDLDQDAASLDDVEVVDEEIELVSFQTFLLDMVKELPRVPQLEVLHEHPDQVGFLLYHT